VRPALSAQNNKNLVIAGRTSALAIANLEEAVKRAKACEAAAVDAMASCRPKPPASRHRAAPAR
jgi:2-methylisocitrate lyase-like PEP mutase family enzyme